MSKRVFASVVGESSLRVRKVSIITPRQKNNNKQGQR